VAARVPPARIDRSAVSALLAACDRGSERGQRDYAVLVLLSRLGLRAFETAGLTLDDVDWRGGTILVRGKGGRADRLPLPSDAGEAMASYLKARPRDLPGRAVFWTVRTPRQPLTRQGVADVVRRACAAAGMEPAGPHRLRHALAGELLAAGAGLGEVAQMLRHQDLRTTAISARARRHETEGTGPGPHHTSGNPGRPLYPQRPAARLPRKPLTALSRSRGRPSRWPPAGPARITGITPTSG
jgi:site-specific recombinase XerD